MGAVYLSYTPGGRPVALKVARAEFAADPEFRRRFEREVTIAQRVQGLYTVPVIDCDPHAPQPWLATAYVAAPSLAAAVARQGPLPVETVLVLLAGVAEALQSIHAAGVIHRDLKPGNVLLAADGPRVIDFGISRATEASSHANLTRTGARIGTPAFMAPEHVQGKPLGPAGDVFSLGATAYYAITGEYPFGGDAAVFHRIAYEEPDWDRCPDQARHVLERCLTKDPDVRPTPAGLIEICRDASTDERLRIGEGWLPATVRADLTRYVLNPATATPAPTTTAPAATPTPPTALTQHAPFRPQLPAPSWPPAPPPTPQPSGPWTPPAGVPAGRSSWTPPLPPGRSRRRQLPWILGALGAVILVIIVAVLGSLTDKPADHTGSLGTGGSTAAADTGNPATSPVAAPTAVERYLTDMQIVQSGQDGKVDTGSASVSGVTYAYSVLIALRDPWKGGSLTMSGEYDLGREFRRFRATVGLRDDAVSGDTYFVEIYGDDRHLASYTMKLGDSVPVDLDITGVLRLRLVTTRIAGNSPYGSVTVFGDARVSSVPSPGPS
jgi:serine/threonine protein kinase